jgi:hypothetical protein
MGTAEDAATKAIIDPYVAALAAYNTKVLGQTTAPIDTMMAFTQETNGANLQADAAVYELAKNGITDVDVHISGAMTNKLIATTATPATLFTLISGGMPQRTAVVLQMNGPHQGGLERAYRNYLLQVRARLRGFYYTTCMLDVARPARSRHRQPAGAPDRQQRLLVHDRWPAGRLRGRVDVLHRFDRQLPGGRVVQLQ